MLVLGTNAYTQNNPAPQPVIIGELEPNNYQVIYPLGWSRGGDFAYILQDVNPLSAMQIYAYNCIVQNMKTDSIVFKEQMKYDLENKNPEDYGFDWKEVDPEDEGAKQHDYAIHDSFFFKNIVWKRKGNFLEKIMKKYDIARKLLVLQPISNLEKFGIQVVEEQKRKEDITQDYSIWITSSSGKRKRVYHFSDIELIKEKTSNGMWYQNYMITGYFKSPYENRIAIVILDVINGFEEPLEFPFLVGAKLDSGF